MNEAPSPEQNLQIEDLEKSLRATFDEYSPHTPPGHEAQSNFSLLGAALEGSGFQRGNAMISGQESTTTFTREDGTKVELKFTTEEDTYRAPQDIARAEENTRNALESVSKHLQLFGDEAIDPDENTLFTQHFMARILYKRALSLQREPHLGGIDAIPKAQAIFGDFDYGRELEAIKSAEGATYSRPEDFYPSVAQAATSLARAGHTFEASLLAGAIPEGDKGRRSAHVVVAYAELALAGDTEAKEKAQQLYDGLIDYQAAEVGSLLTRATGDQRYADYTYEYAMGLDINPNDSTRNMHRKSRVTLLAELSRIDGREDLLQDALHLAETITEPNYRVSTLAALASAGHRESLKEAVRICEEHATDGQLREDAFAAVAIATAEALRPQAP